MAPSKRSSVNMQEIDRLALQLVKDPHSKVFMPLADEYVKAGMWQEAAAVLEDGLKYYPGFITAMVALGRAYDQMGQVTKAKAILEEAVKLSPENLRAHRTLVKIYAVQGLTDAALQCCSVILAVNPQDEEALSIQTQLGTSPPQRPPVKSSAVPIQVVKTVSETPAPPAFTPMGAKSTDPPVVDPLTAAPTLMETTLEGIRRSRSELAGEAVGFSPVTSVSAPSAPLRIVSKLETWLRSIQVRRRDRDHANHARSASS